MTACCRPSATAKASEHALQLATAVMLVEVMRADATYHAAEREAVRAACATSSRWPTTRWRDWLNWRRPPPTATEIYTFTSRIDERFEMAQKIRMVEHMWRVAYADGHLSEHERHVLWRIADLLHVPQGAYVHARMRAAQEAGAA